MTGTSLLTTATSTAERQPQPEENPYLKAAKDYASRGWHVLPIVPRTKRPLNQHGVNEATTEGAVIDAWWEKWPDAGVAISCGPSRLVVVDVDDRNDGPATLAALENEYGQLPLTLSARTAGGKHFYFSIPENVGVKSTVLGPGIDLQAAGKYVVAPPSTHPSGATYEWDDGCLPEPSPLPAWVEQAVKMKTGATAPIVQGSRNTTLTIRAGTMRRNGLEVDEMVDRLQRMNEEECIPPLPPSEVADIAESVARYPAGARTPMPTSRHVFLTPKELLDLPPVEWRVDGFLPTTGFGVLFGQPDSGKSFLALHLAMKVATGEAWFGHNVTQGGVLYVTERLSDLRDRFDALSGHLGLSQPDLPFRFCESFPQLANPRSLTGFLEQLGESEFEPRLVVLDTLARAMVGLAEAEVSVMSQVVEGLERLSLETGATVLAVHHTTKARVGGGRNRSDSTYRGANALEAASQMMLSVEKQGPHDYLMTVTPKRVKGAKLPPAFAAALSSHASTLVVTDTPLPVNASTRPSTDDHVNVLLSVLDELATAEGWVSSADVEREWMARTHLGTRTFAKARKTADEERKVIEVTSDAGGRNPRMRRLPSSSTPVPIGTTGRSAA